jgi:nucleotide-binding universal stress UspA family protein
MKSSIPMPTPAPTPRVRFKRILFATDLGTASEQAQIYASGLARLFGAQLFVLHVQLRRSGAAEGESDPGLKVEELKMDELKDFFQASGMSCTVLLEKGDIAEVLGRVADEYSIDLVIVGSHGWQGVAYLIHGSTSERVSRSSSHPVICVGPHARFGLNSPLKRIVYATDFSEESKLALPFAISLAQEFQAELVNLHVAPRAEHLVKNREQVETYLVNKLKNLAPQSRLPWCSLSNVVRFGNTCEKILEEVQNREADLIVLGLHSAVRFTSHVPERLSYRLLCEAPCPVLTVLPNARELKLAQDSGVLLPMPLRVN